MKSQAPKVRKQKDAFFKNHPQSPLPPQDRAGFKGLVYYPVDENLNLMLEAEEFDEKDEIQMQTSTGDVRSYLRWGRVHFSVDDQPAELTLFYSPESGYFFLPFMDATSGQETYGAGRYLEPHMVDETRVQVDFNLAYSPYCAYNENYSCPIPPAENRLKVRIEAGEKNLN
jgi:hypothetical protein